MSPLPRALVDQLSQYVIGQVCLSCRSSRFFLRLSSFCRILFWLPVGHAGELAAGRPRPKGEGRSELTGGGRQQEDREQAPDSHLVLQLLLLSPSGAGPRLRGGWLAGRV